MHQKMAKARRRSIVAIGWANGPTSYLPSSTKHYNLITKTRIGQVRLISQADLLYILPICRNLKHPSAFRDSGFCRFVQIRLH